MPKKNGKVQDLAAQIRLLSEALSSEEPSQLPPRQARYLRTAINEAYDKLRKLLDDLDPIKHPGFVFDPSNPNIVARIIGITMIAQPRKPLPNAKLERFYGSGVYAIYYNGDFPAYAPISEREHPIYVGKADPADPASKTARDQGDKLSTRLNEHAKNISKAKTTLLLEDFEYRALVVQTGWQNSAETYLINLFKPIWNNEMGISYGFGKHGDAPETRANLRSPWDTLHPGRDWAHRDPKMRDAFPRDVIIESIARHLREHPPLTTIDEILRRFLEEMRTLS